MVHQVCFPSPLNETRPPQIDYTALAALRGGRISVIGNLPYYITSQILFTLADHSASVRQAVVTMQARRRALLFPPRRGWAGGRARSHQRMPRLGCGARSYISAGSRGLTDVCPPPPPPSLVNHEVRSGRPPDVKNMSNTCDYVIV